MISAAYDDVLQQVQTSYDGDGNAIATTTLQRRHDGTGLGDLNDTTTALVAGGGFEAPAEGSGAWAYVYDPTGTACRLCITTTEKRCRRNEASA